MAEILQYRLVIADDHPLFRGALREAVAGLLERVDIAASDRLQDSGLRAVTSGLKGDEWVVVEGINRARPGATVNPKEGTMPRRPLTGAVAAK